MKLSAKQKEVIRIIRDGNLATPHFPLIGSGKFPFMIKGILYPNKTILDLAYNDKNEPFLLSIKPGTMELEISELGKTIEL